MIHRPTILRHGRRILAITAGAWLASLLLFVVAEPHLVYQPFDGPTSPTAAGVPSFKTHTLQAEGLPRITYWENANEGPTVLYFHGNGGGLHAHAFTLKALEKLGLHLIAMEYPGYPGAEGKPSETTIVAQSRALYDHISRRGGTNPVIWGYSLGSGVATQLAATHQASALILEAPPSAIVDRASELFPLAPVHRLMKNQYRSRDAIKQVHAPVFIIHGVDDIIVPVGHGRNLFANANEPKILKEYAGRGHLDLFESTAYADAVAFIRERTKK